MTNALRLSWLTFILATALAAVVSTERADAQPLHLWDFSAADELADSAGSLDLIEAPGEGDVGGAVGTGGDIVYEPGFKGIGQAYRPYYVDSASSSTAGAGLTGSGFTSPSQFTIEAIVKADAKTTGSAVNYIFQTRPGSDRGYFLIQDEDGIAPSSVGGLGSIIGSNFGDVAIGGEYDADETWMFIAATIDLSPAATANVDIYSAVLDPNAPPPAPTLTVSGKMFNTANPDALSGSTGVFGVGGFAVDRNGDSTAEASQEWFQGAIDYIAIYDGLLSGSDLADHLAARYVPEPSSLALAAGLACLLGLVRRRR